MPLTINTNSAAASANYHLSRNQSALQKSLTRRRAEVSSKLLTTPEAGGLHEARVRSSDGGAQKNVQNATSFSKPHTELWLRRANPQPDDRVEGLSQDVMNASTRRTTTSSRICKCRFTTWRLSCSTV